MLENKKEQQKKDGLRRKEKKTVCRIIGRF